MHFPRILLAVISAAVLLPSAMPQAASQSSVNLPRTMRLCANGLCQTLTWNDGNYDGTIDGQSEVTTTFGVVRWERESVDFTGIVSKPDAAGSYITGIFTGKISKDGRSIENGTDTYRAGIATGSIPFTMTWNSNDPSNVVPYRSQDRLPASFRLCGGPCSHQILSGGQYEAYMEEAGNPAQVATYTVASLSPELAYMNVALPNGFRGIVTGKVSGHTLVDGKVTWLNCFNGDTLRVRAAWGEEIASIGPGPIVSVRQQQGPPPGGPTWGDIIAKIEAINHTGQSSAVAPEVPKKSPFTSTLTCASASSASSVDDLYESSGDALDQHDYVRAECLAQADAKRDDVRALNILGLVYTQEDNPNHDDTRGFHYFLDAANKGYSWGELNLAKCFASGVGTDVNIPAEAHWALLARQDPNIRDMLDKNIEAGNARYAAEKREEERDKPKRKPGCYGPHCG